VQLAERRQEIPERGEAWLRAHPEAADELAAAVDTMRANEYVEFEFSLTARC
jgi:hypothetical protein